MDLINKLVRKNILSLTPYSSAREEYSGAEGIFLDANENPFESGINRYPDPLQLRLKKKLSQIKHVNYENIFLGNGSDEPIDLLIRAFCEPGTDNIISIKPTYGMYKVCAEINSVEYREVLLTNDFQIDVEGILNKIDGNSKLLFLCSPNNPTSNSLKKADILQLVKRFPGIVVLDEAYIDFSIEKSLVTYLSDFPNFVLLHTLSKAWGMAGIRLGMAFASREIIQILNRIKYPYNVNFLTQQYALERLNQIDDKDNWVKKILEQREILRNQLSTQHLVLKILPSDANFLMVKFQNPKEILSYLLKKMIIVRDRSKVALCDGCLRITIGTAEENKQLLEALNDYKP